MNLTLQCFDWFQRIRLYISNKMKQNESNYVCLNDKFKRAPRTAPQCERYKKNDV